MEQIKKSNIIYFPDMTKNYEAALQANLVKIIEEIVTGSKLAEINAEYVLALKQKGIPNNAVGYIISATVNKACYEFEVRVKKVNRNKLR